MIAMKLALFGYGRMGRAVEEVARQRGHQITSILDEHSNPEGRGISERSLAGADVAIDFSSAGAVLPNVAAAAGLGTAVVVGTTGWEENLSVVERIVRDSGTGLLYAPNFSVGMLTFARLVRRAGELANALDGYDVHLFEAHHRHKVDHPGGTARLLAQILLDTIDRKERWSTDLHEGRPVPPELLQVSVARVGEVAGVHEVGIDGPDDRIVLRHEARGRLGFARGAVLAAEWLAGRSGIFTMEDLMEELFR